MKIKKAFDICKKMHDISTFTIPGYEQWLTNGFAAWPLCGVPELSEEYICQLYDINDKQREKISFHINMEIPKNYCFNDSDRFEVPAQPLSMNIVIKGKGILQPLLFERGLVLIEKRFTEPLMDSQEEDITYWIRYADTDNVYVAVKVGLLLYAIIVPTVLTDTDYTGIKSIYTAATVTMNDRAFKQNDEQQEHSS